jgi:hypothetical protein
MVRRLRGLLNSGCLRENEVEAKKALLDLWKKELKKLQGEKR